jgi:hypothetical protein
VTVGFVAAALVFIPPLVRPVGAGVRRLCATADVRWRRPAALGVAPALRRLVQHRGSTTVPGSTHPTALGRI